MNLLATLSLDSILTIIAIVLVVLGAVGSYIFTLLILSVRETKRVIEQRRQQAADRQQQALNAVEKLLHR